MVMYFLLIEQKLEIIEVKEEEEEEEIHEFSSIPDFNRPRISRKMAKKELEKFQLSYTHAENMYVSQYFD